MIKWEDLYNNQHKHKVLGELEIKMMLNNNNTKINNNSTILLINNLNNHNNHNKKIDNFLHFKEEEYKLVDMNFIKLLSIYYFIYKSNE